MPIIVNTNIASINAQRHLDKNSGAYNKSLERLASGFRINRAGDDAAGLQISETLRTQIKGSKKALDNVQDGISVLNIADGAQGVIQDNLQRIRELTVQAANDTNATSQRTAISSEIEARRADIDRVANSTKFNGVSLLSSSVPTSFVIQVGPNSSSSNDAINVISGLGNTSTSSGGLNITTANVSTNTAAQAYLDVIDAGLAILNTRRATLGALTNRLESSAQNLSISVENLSGAESRIRNVDVASESSELTRNQILQQASSTVLSQANQAPQLALSLLQR
jgi:flagellin